MICIRQDEETEKAMQVQAMKDVYASAVALLISPGAEDFTFPHGPMDAALEVVDCFVPHLQQAIAADSSSLHTLQRPSLADASFEARVGIDKLTKKMNRMQLGVRGQVLSRIQSKTNASGFLYGLLLW